MPFVINQRKLLTISWESPGEYALEGEGGVLFSFSWVVMNFCCCCHGIVFVVFMEFFMRNELSPCGEQTFFQEVCSSNMLGR